MLDTYSHYTVQAVFKMTVSKWEESKLQLEIRMRNNELFHCGRRGYGGGVVHDTRNNISFGN